MTLTTKRQTVFPLYWCLREGLERGGSVNVFDLGRDGLLIRPIRPPGKEVIARLLKQTLVGRQSSKQATAIVNQALHRVRDETDGLIPPNRERLLHCVPIQRPVKRLEQDLRGVRFGYEMPGLGAICLRRDKVGI